MSLWHQFSDDSGFSVKNAISGMWGEADANQDSSLRVIQSSKLILKRGDGCDQCMFQQSVQVLNKNLQA